MGTPGTIASATHLVDGWPAFDSNPRGQFEDNDFVKIFDIGHGAWMSPIWWQYSSATAKKARTLIKEREAEHELWGLKTPQLCYTLMYLLDYLEDPVVIAIHRDFDDTVASLAKRDGFPIPVAQHIQSLYYLLHAGAKTEVRGRGIPLLKLDFEEVLAGPLGTSIRIANFTGIGIIGDNCCKAADSIHSS